MADLSKLKKFDDYKLQDKKGKDQNKPKTQNEKKPNKWTDIKERVESDLTPEDTFFKNLKKHNSEKVHKTFRLEKSVYEPLRKVENKTNVKASVIVNEAIKHVLKLIE